MVTIRISIVEAILLFGPERNLIVIPNLSSRLGVVAGLELDGVCLLAAELTSAVAQSMRSTGISRRTVAGAVAGEQAWENTLEEGLERAGGGTDDTTCEFGVHPA